MNQQYITEDKHNQPKAFFDQVRGWWTWWVTPRSTDRDNAFRERTIRIIWFTALVFMSVFTIIAALTGLMGDLTVYVAIFLPLFASYFALQTQRITLSGIILLSLVVIGLVNTGMGNGYWSATTTMTMTTALIAGVVILKTPHQRWLLVVLLATYIATVVWHSTQGTPKTIISNDPYSSPLGAIIHASGITFLTWLIASRLSTEFSNRLDQFNKIVETLEERVQERTKELEQAKAEAEEANLIKSQFLANMSHELRTPLNAILNFTGFVADGVVGEVNTEQETMLRQSVSSGTHLLSLINDILDITKIEAGMMDLFIEQLDLNLILHSVVSVSNGLTKDKEIELIVEIDANLPNSYGDKRRLRQVFLNILSNAIKFTNQGEIKLVAKHTGDRVNVEISDSGVGIADIDKESVFESFKQTNNTKVDTIGTGLGMPISKFFVESHGGTIWFESTVDVGTTFFVELPILSEEDATQIQLSVSK